MLSKMMSSRELWEIYGLDLSYPKVSKLRGLSVVSWSQVWSVDRLMELGQVGSIGVAHVDLIASGNRIVIGLNQGDFSLQLVSSDATAAFSYNSLYIYSDKCIRI